MIIHKIWSWAYQYADDTQMYILPLNFQSIIIKVVSKGLETMDLAGRNCFWLNSYKTK